MYNTSHESAPGGAGGLGGGGGWIWESQSGVAKTRERGIEMQTEESDRGPGRKVAL